MLLFITFIVSVLSGVLGFSIFYSGWNWFLTPLNVPPITFIHSIGLTFFINYIKMNSNTTNLLSDKSQEELCGYSFGMLVAQLITLCMMWVVKVNL